MMQSTETSWFVRDCVAGQPRQVWSFDGEAAIRTGVTNPETGAGTFFRAKPGETFWDCIGRQTDWLGPEAKEGSFYLMRLGPAQFYPRMARPIAIADEARLWVPSYDSEKLFIANARGQLTLLARKLENICQTVQPTQGTLSAYGHEIRNLLILAATEAEMHWRGILIANGLQMQRPTSNQYIRLLEPMKLSHYAVTFHGYPDLGPIKPFADWSQVDPTGSLGWYSAYHGVKHNREVEFARGTLRHAFEAVSACIVLLVSQFGPVALNAELSSLIGLTYPDWPIEEMYIPQVTSAQFTPIKHPDL